MKRFRFFLLSIILLCVPFYTWAQNITLSLPHVTSQTNYNGTFGVSLANANAIAGGQLTFVYDATIGLDITDVSTTERTQGFAKTFHKDESDPTQVKIIVLLYSFENPPQSISAGSGDILEFSYQSSNVTGATALTLDATGTVFSDATAAPLSVTIENGSFTVKATEPAPQIASLITNLRDTTFTVAWITDDETAGEVRYGTDPNQLDQRAYDERSATINSQIHHVVLTHLQPDTLYYFDVVSGDNVDDNDGAHYQQRTQTTISLMNSDTVYGQVVLEDGVTPAVGALVYAKVEDHDGQDSSGESLTLSALVQENGYWMLNLGNARNASGSNLFLYSASGDQLVLNVDGGKEGTGSLSVDTAADTPAPIIILGKQPQLQTITTTLYAGWNLLSPALRPTTDPFTDEMLCQDVNAQGGQSIELRTETESYTPSLPFSVFALALGKGYQFRNGVQSEWTLEGTAIESAVALELLSGKTFIGIPHSDQYTAQSLCAKLQNAGVNVTQIDRWNDGWESYLCDLPIAADFPIEPGSGYVVYANNNATVEP